MNVELLDYTKDGIQLIAKMARATRCPKLENGMEIDENRDSKFVKALLVRQHLGILEHINFTFHISEVSRCLTHQLVRHRVASYLQMSGRQTAPELLDFIVPESVKDHWNPTIRRKYHFAMRNNHTLYRELVRDGIPKEDARYVLPPGYFTHMSMTMNARTLRHFLKLRLEKDAQWEIRELACMIFDIVYALYPILFEDLKELREQWIIIEE